jgi:glycosyltransferase involved in cell wall biosynthesis
VNIYGLASISGGVHWYRIREPLRGLAGIGHTTEFGELFDESIVTRHDTILTHALHGDIETDAWGMMADAGQHRLILDIDDNYWDPTEGSDHREYWNPSRLEQLETNIKRAHLITTPSPVLADLIRFKLGLNENVSVLGNYVPAWVTRMRRGHPLAFTVGYQGAPQKLHQSDLDEIQEELFWFLARCPDARLAFYGQPKPLEGAGQFADRVDFIPWNPDVPAYYRSLHGMTVGIGPLRPGPWTDAKSGVRAVEYAALGIPGLFSNTIPYREVVAHRDTGYLISAPRDWRKQLIKLYRSPNQVEQMSKRARALASYWTTEENAWKFERAYLSSGPGAMVSSMR